MGPLVDGAPALLDDLLAPIRAPPHPALMAQFSLRSALPASALARASFRGDRARGLFAGLAAHSMLPLSRLPSGAFGLILGLLAHTAGWPCARGGSQRIADALVSYLRTLGGEVETGRPLTDLAQLEPGRVLLDVTPRQLARIAGDALTGSYRRRLE